MSRMSEVHLEIKEMIESTDLSLPEIASRLNVPIPWVIAVYEKFAE